jgi:hypothetical protein
MSASNTTKRSQPADRVGRPLVLVWLQQSPAFVHAFASVKAIRRNVKSVSLCRFA